MEKNNMREPLVKKELWAVYRKQFLIRAGLNFERQQCVGFTAAMVPLIDKYYDTPEEKAEVMQRHMNLFLTNPMVAAIPIGVSLAMEERIAIHGDMDEETVTSVKTALMGPLAALGDSLINGTLRPLVAGVAISFALEGSIFGPIIFLVVMVAVSLGIRYFGIFKGYEKGVDIVSDLHKSGLIDRLTELASIAAFVIVGGFVPAVVNLSTPLSLTAGETIISIQEQLDGLIPSLLPLALTGLMYYLITKKKANPIVLILALMAAGIAGVYLGIF